MPRSSSSEGERFSHEGAISNPMLWGDFEIQGRCYDWRKKKVRVSSLDQTRPSPGASACGRRAALSQRERDSYALFFYCSALTLRESQTGAPLGGFPHACDTLVTLTCPELMSRAWTV